MSEQITGPFRAAFTPLKWRPRQLLVLGIRTAGPSPRPPCARTCEGPRHPGAPPPTPAPSAAAVLCARPAVGQNRRGGVEVPRTHTPGSAQGRAPRKPKPPHPSRPGSPAPAAARLLGLRGLRDAARTSRAEREKPRARRAQAAPPPSGRSRPPRSRPIAAASPGRTEPGGRAPWPGPRSPGDAPWRPGAPCAPCCAATCPPAPSAWWSSPCWRSWSSSTSC